MSTVFSSLFANACWERPQPLRFIVGIQNGSMLLMLLKMIFEVMSSEDK